MVRSLQPHNLVIKATQRPSIVQFCDREVVNSIFLGLELQLALLPEVSLHSESIHWRMLMPGERPTT